MLRLEYLLIFFVKIIRLKYNVELVFDRANSHEHVTIIMSASFCADCTYFKYFLPTIHRCMLEMYCTKYSLFINFMEKSIIKS